MLIFYVFWMASALVAAVIGAGWASVALILGLPLPTNDQFIGVLLGCMALSQVSAAAVVMFSEN